MFLRYPKIKAMKEIITTDILRRSSLAHLLQEIDGQIWPSAEDPKVRVWNQSIKEMGALHWLPVP